MRAVRCQRNEYGDTSRLRKKTKPIRSHEGGVSPYNHSGGFFMFTGADAGCETLDRRGWEGWLLAAGAGHDRLSA